MLPRIAAFSSENRFKKQRNQAQHREITLCCGWPTILLFCLGGVGRPDRAKAHLKRATEIDAKFKLMAPEDPDLEPLWASLAID